MQRERLLPSRRSPAVVRPLEVGSRTLDKSREVSLELIFGDDATFERGELKISVRIARLSDRSDVLRLAIRLLLFSGRKQARRIQDKSQLRSDVNKSRKKWIQQPCSRETNADGVDN
jgi:Arc/MetJ-type ribon-helix-helix transcriptional regulator